jgi:DNA-directed RNA polymerase subunit RPC12/RpoP
VPLLLKIFLGAVIASLLLLGLAWVGRVAPGAPIVAIPLGILILVFGVRFFSRIADAPPHLEIEPEDVADLDVFFVCGECGTEFRVEKLGELQVPRHCGERMLVERRPRTAPELS